MGNPILCFYHIIVHSLFKSILFLLTSNILILSLSKEIIIHDIFLFINSIYSFIIVNLGAVFTTLYTLKIIMNCFWINSIIFIGLLLYQVLYFLNYSFSLMNPVVIYPLFIGLLLINDITAESSII